MNVIQALGWTLIHSVWEIAGVAALLAVAIYLLKRSSATVRYSAALAALTACAIGPVATYCVLSHDSSASSVAAVDTGFATGPVSIASPISLSSGPISARQGLGERIEPILPRIVELWFAGLILMCIRLGRGVVAIERLKKGSADEVDPRWKEIVSSLAERMGVHRPIQLLACNSLESPAVIGLFRVIVLLPASVMGKMSIEHVEALIAHEIAHVRRFDYLLNLIQSVIETVLFFHPAVWWISSVVRAEREHCCDELAAGAIGDRVGYARALVGLEELRSSSPQLVMSAAGSNLKGRIQRLLTSPGGGRFVPAWPALGLVIVLGFLAVPRLYSQELTKRTAKVHLVGRVLTPTGGFASGATVYCQSLHAATMESRFDQVRADRLGMFAIDVAGDDFYQLSAYQKGVGIASDSFKSELIPDGSLRTLWLQRPVDVYVQVVDRRGAPVRGVVVGPREVFKGGVMFRPDPDLVRVLNAKTDERGVAPIRDLPAEGYASFETEDPRYATTTMAVPLTAGRLISVTAEPACAIVGKATENGAPVQGASVTAVTPDSRHNDMVVTKADGSFVLNRFPSGPVLLVAQVNSGSGTDWVAPSKRSVIALGKNRVDFSFEKGTVVRGRVVDEKDRPLERFAIEVSDNDFGPPAAHAMGKSDGTFQVRLVGGKYEIRAWKQSVVTHQRVTVRPGQEGSVTLRVSGSKGGGRL